MKEVKRTERSTDGQRETEGEGGVEILWQQ